MASTLSIKFRESNRNGWMPFNPYEINYSEKVENYLVGDYVVLYCSELKGKNEKFIKSKLIIGQDGAITFYNNIKRGITDAEYSYHGICRIDENTIYIYLYNWVPVCIKIAGFKEELFVNGVNKNLLREIITSSNANWENNMLIIEEEQKHLFFSDEILMADRI